MLNNKLCLAVVPAVIESHREESTHPDVYWAYGKLCGTECGRQLWHESQGVIAEGCFAAGPQNQGDGLQERGWGVGVDLEWSLGDAWHSA